MNVGKKIFYPKIYPLDHALNRLWFIRYYIKDTEGVLQKQIKRIPKKILTVEQKLDWASNFLKKLENGLETKEIVHDANQHITKLFALIESKKIKSKTRSSYRSHVNGLNEYCKNQKIKSITGDVAFDFLEHLLQTHEGRTVNHYRRTLLALFETLKKKKEIKSNPFAKTERSKTKKPFSESWSDAEIKLISEKVKVLKPQLALPMLIILHCATRNGVEMPNLKVKDIDFDKGVLWIDKEFSKNGEREKVKIPSSLMHILRGLKIETYNPDFYLLTKTGVPNANKVGCNYFNAQFKEVLKELGMDIKGKGFYRLKNSLAVKLVKNKVNTFALQKQFRHKSIVTTEKYLASLNIDDFPELDNFSFF
jgi:integrase